MKKFITMLFAAVAVFATSMSLVSCGGSDDSSSLDIGDIVTEDSYTIMFSCSKGNMTDEEYALVQTSLAKLKRTENSTKVVAIAAFEACCEAVDDQVQKIVDSESESGFSDVTVTAHLLDSKGNSIDSKEWKPSK